MTTAILHPQSKRRALTIGRVMATTWETGGEYVARVQVAGKHCASAAADSPRAALRLAMTAAKEVLDPPCRYCGAPRSASEAHDCPADEPHDCLAEARNR